MRLALIGMLIALEPVNGPGVRGRLRGFTEDVGVDEIRHRVSVGSDSMGTKNPFSGHASSQSTTPWFGRAVRRTSRYSPRSKGTITAKVQGTRPYRVKLWVDDGELECSGTCPVGTDGAFCKHGVAVGLAWLEQGQTERAPGRKHAKPAVTMDDVRACLAGQNKNVLVDMRPDLLSLNWSTMA